MPVFTRQADLWLGRWVVGTLLVAVMLAAGLYYYHPPEYTRVGYAPKQPVPFSHAQHAGKLGMSCLYCHSSVEESPHANVPTTQVCMTCHQVIKANSDQLALVRASWKSGEPIHWKRVHKTPDYISFNHAVHVRRGVGCVSCHGKINEMPVVVHDQPLSMGWCLDCHRHPESHLRPISEVTNLSLDWQPPRGQTRAQHSALLKERNRINAPRDCAGCHQ